MSRGVYILIIEVVNDSDIDVGALGTVKLRHGTWLYVGSAMGTGSSSLEGRIRRHLSRDKKMHWHIDRLVPGYGSVRAVVSAWTPIPTERRIAAALRDDPNIQPGPVGFGCSDMGGRSSTHLYRVVDGTDPISLSVRVLTELGMSAEVRILS
ncbi:MAG: GIY-YIG nuclease family protein [Candidatus Thorarchaeota archaeon]